MEALELRGGVGVVQMKVKRAFLAANSLHNSSVLWDPSKKPS